VEILLKDEEGKMTAQPFEPVEDREDG